MDKDHKTFTVAMAPILMQKGHAQWTWENMINDSCCSQGAASDSPQKADLRSISEMDDELEEWW